MTSLDSAQLAKAAKSAFEASQLLDSLERTKALNLIKHELELQKTEILEANRRDMEVCCAFRVQSHPVLLTGGWLCPLS